MRAAGASLPAAQPVQSARASTPASGGRRSTTPWLLLSIAALVIVGLVAAGALSLGLRDDTVLAASGTEEDHGRDAIGAQCVSRALGENGGRSDLCVATADRDEFSPGSPDAPSVDAVDDEIAASGEPRPGNPAAPDAATSEAPDPSDPSTGTPGAGAPSEPAAPAPGAPVPAPPAPVPPAPSPPPPAPTARPLAFAGISENHVLGLLGIRILSSYTLSLSGQPGATASVTYGSSHAGSVTFDSAGRASITLGGTLINAGLGNPTIVVAYADGTAGSSIQARRDSI